MRRLILAAALACASAGLFAGAGVFTFVYAKGYSYLSADPGVCVNCHIMRPQYDAWVKSSHHGVATCNDCHMPTAFLDKYYTKAENGFRHSAGFTLQNFHEPILITPRNARILQANCVRCHGDLVHGPGAVAAGSRADCVHCHVTVGHGERTGMGKWDPRD